jgi:DNA invertase Pin-like site-specific DNA recombinase
MPAIHSSPVSAGPVPVAIYTRVSTTDQVGGRFDSCEAQAAVCRDYLRKRAAEGWHEVACHTDAAYSGGTMNRPGIRALQRQIEAGEVKVVLIYKFERVLRNTDEWGPFRALLQKHGCRLVSTTEDLTDETPSGRLKNNLLVSVAEYERLNTAEKIRSKLAEQAKRGLWNGGQVPFGYNYDPAAKALHPHQAEAAVVRRIYEAAAQLVSLTKLANQLNAEGLRTRQRVFRMRDGVKVIVGGKRFRSDAIRHMIQRPVYAGRVRLTGREYPGQHEALVSKELWEAANAAVGKFLQPDHRRLHARDKHFHLLKGVACCGHCGRAMVPAPSGKRDAQGRPYRYYVCGQSQKERADSPCTVRHVAASVLESAVLGFLGECSRQPGLLQKIVER